MKKILKPILISVLIMLLTSIGFFMSFFAPVSKQNIASADLTAVSGEVINLTSRFGTTPTHYFTDESGASTLSNASVSDKEIKYYNEKGEYVSKFYVIEGKSKGTSKKYSYGYSNFYLPEEMKEFARKGILYVQASAGVISEENKDSSNIELRIMQGDKAETAQSNSNENGTNVEQWVKTNYIKVDSENFITFYFTTLGQGSGLSKCKYKIVEPKLVFKTIISGVQITETTEKVGPGQVLKLAATNEALELTTNTNYAKYYRTIHKAQYEIIEGAQYAEIIDGYIYFTDENVDATVTIIAKSQKDSIEGGYVESAPKTYTIVSKQMDVKIQKDFEYPADFFGSGSYHIGQKITLSVKPKERFKFIQWEINSEIYTSRRVLYTVQETNDIKCILKKNIFVSSVELDEKVYDGSAIADCRFLFEGIESGHNVYMVGLTSKYIDAQVGVNKHVFYEGYPELAGDDAGLYILGSTNIPDVVGTIRKKEVKITTHDMSKTYGDIDDAIPYEADDSAISGKLGREPGENIGRYLINIGELNTKNPNYNCTLQEQHYYTITKREVSVENIKVAEKIYDKTTDAELTSYTIKNKVANDDLALDLSISFTDYNAGEREIRFDKIALTGESKDNYTLLTDGTVFKATIKPKALKITTKDGSSIFGDEINLEYDIEGLLENDSLSGNIAIDGTDAGTYTIRQNTLNNPNYAIEFIGATYVISKRNINVVAKKLEKVYGENDPEFEYSATNLIDSEPLEGKLVREEGEDVGVYKISLGTLSNINYNIESFTGSEFVISSRKISLDITIEDKVYDGNTSANYSYFLSNIAGRDQIEFNATMEFENASAGDNKKIIIKNSYFFGDRLNNYTIEEIFGELKASIKRKDVFVTVADKTIKYGDDDVALTYTSEGLLEGEVLVGSLERESGRDAGEYEIHLNDITNENNKNYNIISKNQAYYTILRQEIELESFACEKIYGENDPVLRFEIKDLSKLQYDDTPENLFEGNLEREEGENPGKYLIKIGTLNCPKNYTIKSLKEQYLLISKRDIEVKANDSSKVYGEEDPELSYTAKNVVNGDKLSLKLKREYGENVGTYTITYTSLNDPRYNINFENAKFSISPKHITVKADDKYKEYGEADPIFTISIVEGKLENDDEIESIEVGKMTREDGEGTGEYEIQVGSYSLGGNYIIDFIPGKLNVMKVEIEIKADTITKKYGNKDGVLTFTITNGALKGEDQFEGTLSREEGEATGEYAILQGSLKANDNYILTFIAGTFIIEKRPLTITADALTKVYGEEDPKLTYTLSDSLCEGDTLEGTLEREKPVTAVDPKAYEKTGRYLISSTLSNDNYEITFIPAYFTIQRREITILAEDKQKTYGEEDPELTYVIQSGTILEGDEFTGNIYRVSGDNAGTYDIRSNLSLGRNYKINFIKGSFVIKPIDIYVKTYDYEKTYGDITPTFKYEITSGELLGGDVLLGGVSKEGNDEVGKYRLVSAFNNVNYNVILTENYLTIHPKKAYLSVNIQDKVYDGTTVAYIKNPVISGLIDEDVKLSYDKERSAKFESAEVGNNIKVVVYNVSLVGDKAKDYEIVYPENLTANITYNELADEDEKVSLESKTNTTLSKGTKLVVDEENVDYSGLVNSSKQVVASFNVSLEENNVKKDLKDSIKVKFEIPVGYGDRTNFYIYGRNRNGDYVLLSSTRNGDYLEVETDTLGEFVILSDNEVWIDIGSYVSIGVIAAFAIYMVTAVAVKSVKKKKKQAA